MVRFPAAKADFGHAGLFAETGSALLDVHRPAFQHKVVQAFHHLICILLVSHVLNDICV